MRKILPSDLDRAFHATYCVPRRDPILVGPTMAVYIAEMVAYDHAYAPCPAKSSPEEQAAVQDMARRIAAGPHFNKMWRDAHAVKPAPRGAKEE